MSGSDRIMAMIALAAARPIGNNIPRAARKPGGRDVAEWARGMPFVCVKRRRVSDPGRRGRGSLLGLGHDARRRA